MESYIKIIGKFLDERRKNKDFKGFKIENFKPEYEKIKEVIEQKNVFKYEFFPSNNHFWVVSGKTDEHFLFPGLYCTCKNFHFKLISRTEVRKFCYHSLSLIVALVTNQYFIIKKHDSDYEKYMNYFFP